MAKVRQAMTDCSGQSHDDCWQSLGDVAQHVLSDVTRQRAAEHLHQLGPRPMLEAMAEIVAGAELDTVLDRYYRLDPDVIKALKGDKFPTLPVHEVAP